MHGIAGAVVLVVGSALLAVASESSLALALGIGASAAGLYLLIAGGVARGIQLARLAHQEAAAD